MYHFFNIDFSVPLFTSSTKGVENTPSFVFSSFLKRMLVEKRPPVRTLCLAGSQRWRRPGSLAGASAHSRTQRANVSRFMVGRWRLNLMIIHPFLRSLTRCSSSCSKSHIRLQRPCFRSRPRPPVAVGRTSVGK